MNNVGIKISDKEFREIRDIVWKTTGISLADTKKALVISRLARRLRELELGSFLGYITRLKSDTDELAFFTNRITTNLTRFYREMGQFHILKKDFFPDILRAKGRKKDKKLRVWSAGCSSGEEVYTILLEILDYFDGRIPALLDLRILGSDIDTTMLKKAAAGLYDAEGLKDVPPPVLHRYFETETDNRFRVKESLKKYVTFSRINLVYDVFDFPEPFDIIFCRNVVIYFDKETKKKVYDKFYACLNEPGYFCSGHSENLLQYSHMFKLIGKSVYKKIA